MKELFDASLYPLLCVVTMLLIVVPLRVITYLKREPQQSDFSTAEVSLDENSFQVWMGKRTSSHEKRLKRTSRVIGNTHSRLRNAKQRRSYSRRWLQCNI